MSETNKTVIRAEHIRKSFRIYNSNIQRMRHLLLPGEAGEENIVLEDVSFEIKKGEKVAILTSDEGGKSTLFRILAGIFIPDSGKVELFEEPTIILDYKAGFDTALSGRDNYRIRAKVMGWPDELAKEREDEIFAFAGLTAEKDILLKKYPRRGAIKLGFAIVTADKTDFLLMDEKLSFGNNVVNEKYINRFAELITPEMTLVMSANNPKINARFCDRGIVVQEGRVSFDGPIDKALSFHSEHAVRKKTKGEHTENEDISENIEVNETDYSDDAF